MAPTSPPPPKSGQAHLVDFLIVVLKLIFMGLQCWLGIVLRIKKTLFPDNTKKLQDRKTVVIVGGNFAGLAALWELSSRPDLFKIILIDQREYFEFTPGILRLFCEPEYFSKITKKLPSGGDYHRVIRGKVTSIVDDSNGGGPQKVLTYEVANTSNAETAKLRYDYLVMATGATYISPISPVADEMTLRSRLQGWQAAHNKLASARKILILGGGAVGVELAAEIVDYFPGQKQVTVLDAQSAVVPMFPKAVGDYAHKWLTNHGVVLRLGEKLKSWNDTSCTLLDGTVLEADIVYVCFGNKPNSDCASTSKKSDQNSMINGRRHVVVGGSLEVQGGPIQDGSIFACGDVACPPSNGEKQALQAEIQGKVVARNILRAEVPLHESSVVSKKKGYRYPEDIAGSAKMPLVFVLSLGRSDGVLGFNKLAIPGPVAAVFKFILEYTKVLHMSGEPLGKLIWKIGDAVVLFLSRTVVKPP